MLTEEDRKLIQKLLKRIAKGDVDAYTILYEKYYDLFFKFVWAEVKNKQIAEDIVQDFFERLLRKDYKFTIFTNGPSYLYKILKNLCNDYFRRQGVRDNYIKNVVIKDDCIYIEDEDGILINDAVRGLSDMEERLVLLKYKDYSLKEIAKQINVSERTLHRKFIVIKQKVQRNLEIIDDEKETK